MSEIKLLPCPFCGGEAVLDVDELGNWVVRCEKCFCRTARSISKFFPTISWNTRKPMQEIVERLEEERTKYDSLTDTSKEFSKLISNKYWGMAIGYEDAIAIVREVGGMNE